MRASHVCNNTVNNTRVELQVLEVSMLSSITGRLARSSYYHTFGWRRSLPETLKHSCPRVTVVVADFHPQTLLCQQRTEPVPADINRDRHAQIVH